LSQIAKHQISFRTTKFPTPKTRRTFRRIVQNELYIHFLLNTPFHSVRQVFTGRCEEVKQPVLARLRVCLPTTTQTISTKTVTTTSRKYMSMKVKHKPTPSWAGSKHVEKAKERLMLV
jgi:hypothetical protein